MIDWLEFHFLFIWVIFKLHSWITRHLAAKMSIVWPCLEIKKFFQWNEHMLNNSAFCWLQSCLPFCLLDINRKKLFGEDRNNFPLRGIFLFCKNITDGFLMFYLQHINSQSKRKRTQTVFSKFDEQLKHQLIHCAN